MIGVDMNYVSAVYGVVVFIIVVDVSILLFITTVRTDPPLYLLLSLLSS